MFYNKRFCTVVFLKPHAYSFRYSEFKLCPDTFNINLKLDTYSSIIGTKINFLKIETTQVF